MSTSARPVHPAVAAHLAARQALAIERSEARQKAVSTVEFLSVRVDGVEHSVDVNIGDFLLVEEACEDFPVLQDMSDGTFDDAVFSITSCGEDQFIVSRPGSSTIMCRRDVVSLLRTLYLAGVDIRSHVDVRSHVEYFGGY